MTETRVARTVKVVNPKGLHARPASKIAKLTQGFDAQTTISHGGETAEAESIMDLLMLAAVPGAELVVEVEGPDANAALTAIVDLIDRGFDEV